MGWIKNALLKKALLMLTLSMLVGMGEDGRTSSLYWGGTTKSFAYASSRS